MALASFYAVHARLVPGSQRLLVDPLDFADLGGILLLFKCLVMGFYLPGRRRGGLLDLSVF